MKTLCSVFAHSLDKKSSDQWQTLDVHLKAVAGQAEEYATAFNSGDFAWNAGWLHDLGKAAPQFQNYLREQNGLDGLNDPQYDASGRINHSSAGAALAERNMPNFAGRSLAYLAAGHHAGLTDYGSGEAAGKGALKFRLNNEGFPLLDAIPAAAVEVAAQLRPLTKLPKFLASDGEGKGVHFWLRMLFSCLTDADFLDTEGFMNRDQAASREQYPALAALKPAFDRHMASLAAEAQKKSPTLVNAIRQEVLAASRAAALEAPGLFSMNVPTGGGKTLAAMAFALDHALKHGKRRIIYVIPYTSIIEQTANVLAGIFGRENIVEHHSNLDPDKETQRSRLAAENWDAPVIITTNVQFFESLYAARPSRCRKLHNIVNSVVILDEAQLLPPDWLAPCVDAINRLAADYGATVVLSTATQPSPPDLAAWREIGPDFRRLHDDLKRVEIKMPADLETRVQWETLADELAGREQVLCVVNARRDCHDLYKALLARVPEAEQDSVIHLSALMCGEHRSKVIAAIKQRLKDKLPTRVVSTQLVEAGVDLDFPVVYRALAGLDSIAQAAGRCNREGKLTDAQGRPVLGEVIVFVPPKDPPKGMLLKAANTTRELAVPGFDPQNPDAYGQYFGLFYCKLNNLGNEWLKEKLVKDVRAPGGPQLQFRTAAEEFKLIDDEYQQPVIVRYGESEKWIEDLRAAGPKREIMRRLQRYTVNLPRRAMAALIADGKLEMLDSGIVVQTLPGIYQEEVGLDIFGQTFPFEDMVQ